MATTATDLGADNEGLVRNTDDSSPGSPGGSDLSEDIDRDDDVFDESQQQHRQLKNPSQSHGQIGRASSSRRPSTTASSSAGNKRSQGLPGSSSKKRTSNTTPGVRNVPGQQQQQQQQQQGQGQGSVVQGQGDMMMPGQGVMLERLLDVDYPRDFGDPVLRYKAYAEHHHQHQQQHIQRQH